MTTLQLFHNNDTGAVASECGQYRYRLWRRWSDKPALLFIMLNPSTTRAAYNDPTTRKCQAWAYRWGFGSLEICNLFAFRSPYPEIMRAAADPIGPDNDACIKRTADDAGLVVCAWGAHGNFMRRDAHVVEMLRRQRVTLHALGLTAGGLPAHPLYLLDTVTPQVWKGARDAKRRT